MNVLDLMRELQQAEQTIQKVDKGILFLGNTGVGKSTLIHYIVENPHLYICETNNSIEEKQQDEEEETEIIYKIKDSLNKFSNVKIGQGMKSATSIPITISHQNIFYRDLPGFQDNRMNGQNLDTQDLKNSFYFSQIFKKTQFLKVILVVKSAHIQGKATQFLSFIRNIKERFGRLSDIQKCSLIIFGHHRDEKILTQMRQVIKLYQENNLKEQAQFVKCMLNNKNFFKFNKLKSTGPVDFTLSNQIRSELQSLEWKKNDFKKEIVLSPITKSILGNNQQRVQKQMKTLIESFSTTISNDFKKLYEQGKKSKLIKQMLKLKKQVDEISKLTNRTQITQNLKYAFKQLPTFSKSLANFQGALNFLDLISKINAQKPFYQISQILNTIKYSIQLRINNQRKIILFNENDVAFQTIKKNITSEEIQIIINENQEFSHFIFFIHEAELNSDVIAKGKNLLIFGKIIKTSSHSQTNSKFSQKKFLFDLSGKDAQAIVEYADDRNGKPGLNGQNGGNLYLKVDQIIGNEIQVNLRGGKGGDGQNCRITNLEKYIPDFNNGKIFQKDCQNEEKNKVFLKERVPYGFKQKKGLKTVTHCLKTLSTFNGQVLETYSNDTPKAFEKYYKLIPGEGGYPGNSGKVVHLDKKSQAVNKMYQIQRKIFQLKKKNFKGRKGTLIIDKYQGKYRRQLVFSAMRQQGKSFSAQQSIPDAVFLSTIGVGGGLLVENTVKTIAEETVKKQFIGSAIKDVITSNLASFWNTGKLLAFSASKQVIKQTSKRVAQEASKQAAKQVTFSLTQSSATASILGGVASLSFSLAIKGMVSPISAYLSSGWQQQIKYKGQAEMEINYKIQAQPNNNVFEIKDNQCQSLLQMYKQTIF